MAYVPGYDYDIFISYAWVDNEDEIHGPGENQGWITHFRDRLIKNLRTKLGEGARELAVYRDRDEMQGNTSFDTELINVLNSTVVVIPIYSVGYAASPNCRQELEEFTKATATDNVSLNASGRKRVFPVFIQKIEWNERIEGISELNQNGYEFFTDATPTNQLGSMLHSKDDRELYNDRIDRLSNQLAAFLREFKSQKSETTPVDQPVNGDNVNMPIDVFMADVDGYLSNMKNNLTEKLEEDSILVKSIPPPPPEASQHDSAMTGIIDNMKVSVHLMHSLAGLNIANSNDKSYVQRQAELCLEELKALEQESTNDDDKPKKVSIIWMDKFDQLRNTISALKQAAAAFPPHQQNYIAFLEGLMNGINPTSDNPNPEHLYIVSESEDSMQDAVYNKIKELLVEINQDGNVIELSQKVMLHYYREKDMDHGMSAIHYFEQNQIEYTRCFFDKDPITNYEEFNQKNLEISKIILVHGNVNLKRTEDLCYQLLKSNTRLPEGQQRRIYILNFSSSASDIAVLDSLGSFPNVNIIPIDRGAEETGIRRIFE